MTPIYYHPDQDADYAFISVKKVSEFVRQSGRKPEPVDLLEPGDLHCAHSAEFVDGVMAGKRPNGFGNKDPEVNRAVMASNSAFFDAAVHALRWGGVTCSATQGFHHAHWDHCWGYCTFNGLMVAAVRTVNTGARVMIVDGDGHYGDGTDDIIGRLGLEGKVAHIRREDLGASRHTHWEHVMWRSFFTDLIRQHRPGIIYYQAGADAWDQDPYQAGYLSKEGLAARDRGLFTAARGLKVPVVWNLAGGYSDPMQLTIDLHLQTLAISDEVYYGSTEVPSQRTQVVR
jgi:acetoin utilization deacetylase AcuC-like enzyme